MESSKESEKILLLKISHLKEELAEKSDAIENYELQFKKLYDDFNYNVELIYERDRDMEQLNEQLEEKNLLITKKDKEILELKEQVARLKALEHENLLLNKKLESFLDDKSERKLSSRVDTKAPRLDYKNLLRDNRSVMTKKINYLHNHHQSDKSSIAARSEYSLEMSLNPINELNFDLESRIKALEVENSSKDRKSSSLSNSKVYESSMELDSDVFDARQKVKRQEKEISELIKSLQVYKKQSDMNSKSKLKVYDDQIVALNEDIKRLKKNDSLELEEKKYKQMVRPRSNMDKRIT